MTLPTRIAGSFALDAFFLLVVDERRHTGCVPGVPVETSPRRMAPSTPEPNVEAPKSRWPMTCTTCNEEWPRETWSELPPIGRYDAGRDGWIELRSCVCGTTLAVPADDLDGG